MLGCTVNFATAGENLCSLCFELSWIYETDFRIDFMNYGLLTADNLEMPLFLGVLISIWLKYSLALRSGNEATWF